MVVVVVGEMINTCSAFTIDRKEILVPWNILLNFRDNSFRFGPAGGKRELSDKTGLVHRWVPIEGKVI